jgi:hypothetical protein
MRRVCLPLPLADADETSSTFSFSSSSRNKAQPLGLSEPLHVANGKDISEDPFYVFKEDLHRKVEQVDESLAEFLRIIHQTVRLGCLGPCHADFLVVSAYHWIHFFSGYGGKFE